MATMGAWISLMLVSGARCTVHGARCSILGCQGLRAPKTEHRPPVFNQFIATFPAHLLRSRPGSRIERSFHAQVHCDLSFSHRLAASGGADASAQAAARVAAC